MHVVRIWVRFASEDLTYIKSLQSTFDCLNLLKGVNLKTCACKGSCHFLCRKVEIDIFLKPFVRNVHLIFSMFVFIVFFTLYSP